MNLSTLRLSATASLSTVAALNLAGCGTAVPSASLQGCKGGPTSPITARQLEQALKSGGFSVRRDTESGVCSAEDIEVALANSAADIDREGHVLCDARRETLGSGKLRKDLDAPPASPIFSGEKAEFSFENIECTIYPRGDTARQQVRRLERVIDELAGTLP